MTDEALGPLGRRFLVAFAVVALAAVTLVAVAALVGTEQGLTSQSDAERRAVASRTAAAAADAYAAAGGWEHADLASAQALARGGGAAALLVLSPDGSVVWPQGDHAGRHAPGSGSGPSMGPSMGPGMGPGMGGGTGMVPGSRTTADVVVNDSVVGQVALGFSSAAGGAGRPVAWTWIIAAAVLALLLAVAAAWFVSRQLTRPVAALTRAARSFAAGDRAAVVGERGAGELAELADAFDEAVAAVRRAEASRSQMAADVAHELRTPLAALQAGLEELRDGLAPPDPAALARLHDQSLRVAQVVGDLDALFAAEGATRVVRSEPVDLVALAEEGVAARAAQLRAAELDVTLDLHDGDGVWVQGDPERLHQVVGNLLENCVRHCRPGDAVTVRVDGSDGSRASLSVSDSGPGIPPEDLPHVFDRFWRGSHQSGRPGSGLGLAVVRSLVEAQGGTVTARSDGHSGSTFTVDLPRLRLGSRSDHAHRPPLPLG
jgi:two-component system sensor histidine kinase BaeS